MNHQKLCATLKNQRSALLVEPLHKAVEPVRAYAKQIATLKGEPFSVIAIPEGSTAYIMGYRYASIPNTELEDYLANGATLAPAEAG